MSASEPILSVRALEVTFQPASLGETPRRILRDVSFDLEAGQSLAILGASGGGKSVLLRGLTRFFHGLPLWQADGEVWFDGENLMKMGQNRLFAVRGGRIAYLLQDANALLNPQLTIQQHFRLLLRFKQRKLTGRLEHAMQYLYLAGVVEPEELLLARVFPDELDVETRQRIMIASALACEPDILLADEPTQEFDSGGVRRFVEVLEGLKRERGMAVVVSTGRLRRAEQLGDAITALHDGKLTEPLTPKSFFQEREDPVIRAFVDGTLLAGSGRERLLQGQ